MNVAGDVTHNSIYGLGARAATVSTHRGPAANLRTLERIPKDVKRPIEGAVA